MENLNVARETGAPSTIDLQENTDEIKRLRKRVYDLENFIEDANIAIHWVGPDGTILWANKAELDYMGYKPEEYIGRNITEFHADSPTITSILSKLSRNEKLVAQPARLKTKDGVVRDVEIYSSVRFDDDQFIHTRCFTYDVTEQRRLFQALQRSEARYKDLAGNLEKIVEERTQQLEDAQSVAHVGSWEWDLGSNKVLMSRELARLYGMPTESLEIDFEKFLALRIEKDRPRVKAILDTAIKERKEFTYECVIQRVNDNDFRTIAVNGRVMNGANGKPGKIIGTNQDITDWRAFQEELVRKNKELERSNEELESFAYVASHDLKEPLRMITSYIDLIEKKIKTVHDPEIEEFMDFVQSGSRRLQSLIDDLLKYSRIGRGNEIRMERVNMQELAEEVAHVLRNRIAEAGATLKINPLPECRGIPTLLTQLLQNLVDNALKFKTSDRKPEIEIGAKSEGNEVLYYVADNGIGIKSDYFSKIFMMFQRLHSASEFAGTGIGLTISRKIVDLHGGKIWPESEPGKGTTFYFTLPS